jgi:hypothetical protein
MAANKKPAPGSAAPGAINHPDTYLGTSWVGDDSRKMPDPTVPMPIDDPDAGAQQIRRAHGYGYSDYT